MKVNQITELPEAKAQVIEVQTVRDDLPGVWASSRWPSRRLDWRWSEPLARGLEATVVYYRQEQHMSYERTQRALLNLHGVEISQGGIDEIMQRAGEKAIQDAEPIQKTVRQSAVIHSDETSSRVDGDNWWEWVFCTGKAIWHVIRFNRSEDVIREFMDSARPKCG